MNIESEYQKLLKWFEKSEQLLPKQTKYLMGSITLSVSSTVLAAFYLVNSISDGWNLFLAPLLLVLLINYLILKKVAPLAEEIIDHTHRNVQTLGGYQRLAQTILSEKFQSKKLKELRSDLNQNESSAANEIRILKKILESFQLRGTKRSDSNKFYVIFNNFWLFDIYWIILTERWKRRNRNHIQSWIRAISEFEVLNSLSGFAYSNPDFVFPEIKEEPYSINFEMLGHPLIKRESRSCNHFKLQECGQIAMIIGSNMAGKSTFLRTVGVNLILALMGAPCCAKSGQVSHMKIFTSMRTQDNLEEGISSFYAELKRVEQLLALIKSGQPIFFMLDEMFKGTNSEDRYKGGVSLIKQLSELNAFGIISTHDLELARLAGNHMLVSNHSFNSKIQNGELSFNYKLQDGICTDLNASELMKKSGIKILSNLEKMQ
jgi:DNA mismatch repair ATPase MutS